MARGLKKRAKQSNKNSKWIKMPLSEICMTWLKRSWLRSHSPSHPGNTGPNGHPMLSGSGAVQANQQLSNHLNQQGCPQVQTLIRSLRSTDNTHRPWLRTSARTAERGSYFSRLRDALTKPFGQFADRWREKGYYTAVSRSKVLLPSIRVGSLWLASYAYFGGIIQYHN